MITNPLTDALPVKVRKYLYAIVALAALVFASWQAAEGSIEAFIGGLITTLVTALAASNTNGS